MKNITLTQQANRYNQIRRIATKLRRREKRRAYIKFRDLYQSVYDSREFIKII